MVGHVDQEITPANFLENRGRVTGIQMAQSRMRHRFVRWIAEIRMPLYG
jgi:hypothetical protein